jgi:hypothetical protein
MNEYELGYLAGMIDGEGTFGIRRKYNPAIRKDRKRGYSWEYYVAITNTDYSVIIYLKELLGGGCISKPTLREGQKQTWRINFYPKILREVLPKLKLIIKEEHRLLFLVVLQIMKKRTNSKIRDKRTNRFIGTITTEEDENILNKIYEQIKVLNRRGR